MQKILALLTAIVMLLSALVPAWAGNTIDGVATGDWIAMLVEEFNMDGSDYSPNPHYPTITSSNPYFKVVQIAYEWGVINDDDAPLNVNANVTNEFVAITLVRVAGIELKGTTRVANAAKLNDADAVAAAVDAGLFKLDFLNRFKVKVISKADALAALAKAKELWNNKKFGAPAAQALTEDEIKFSGDFAPALQVAEITAGNGAVLQKAPVDFDAPGGVTQSQIDIIGLLKKLDVKFSLGDFDFKVKVTDDGNGFDLGVGAKIADGVKLSKEYRVSNLNVSTKFDGGLENGKIKYAYLRADYDLEDVTRLTGSYAASVAVDESKLPEDAGPVDFLTAAKAGALALMPGGGNKITVFSVNVPIPNLPTVTISLDVNIRITVDGKIEITIESSNVKGIEIIDGKVRIINEVEYGKQTYDIMADIRFTVGFCFSIKALGYILVDAEFEVGIGIKVTAYIQTNTAVYTLDVPIDLAMGIPYPEKDGAEFCGNAKIYGLMYISVGQNSKLLKLVGLSKTWTIFDENNAVIYNLHIEENGVVDACTRART
jgi:hypothetical protein